MGKEYKFSLNSLDYEEIGHNILNEGILDGDKLPIESKDRKKEILKKKKSLVLGKTKDEIVAIHNLINYMMNLVKNMKHFNSQLPSMDEQLMDFVTDFELDSQKIDDNLINSVNERLKKFQSDYSKLRSVLNDLTINGQVFLKFLGNVYEKLHKRNKELKDK